MWKSHEGHMTSPAPVPRTCQRRPSSRTASEWKYPPPSCSPQHPDLQDKQHTWPLGQTVVLQTACATCSPRTSHVGNPLSDLVVTQLQVLCNVVDNLSSIVSLPQLWGDSMNWGCVQIYTTFISLCCLQHLHNIQCTSTAMYEAFHDQSVMYPGAALCAASTASRMSFLFPSDTWPTGLA